MPGVAVAESIVTDYALRTWVTTTPPSVRGAVHTQKPRSAAQIRLRPPA
jgi:hypothetical protein